DDPREQRTAGDLAEDLAGQASGGEASGNDAERAYGFAHRWSAQVSLSTLSREESYFAHASPSAPLPAVMSFSTFHCARSMAATCPLFLQETYATRPAGRMRTSCGALGTSMVWTTCMVWRSITATWLLDGIAT